MQINFAAGVPTFAEAYAAASKADREWLLERAAIREWLGMQPRPDAEAGALADYQRWLCTPD